MADSGWKPAGGESLCCKQARAEVLAACDKVIHAYCVRYGALDASNNTFRTCRELQKQISELQPSASDLEELAEKAHEAALPHAAEQLLKAITEGGDFAVGSPLNKAKKRVEELLREAQLEVVKTSPECWHYNTETEREFIDRYFAWRGRRIERLEKARAFEGKG